MPSIKRLLTVTITTCVVVAAIAAAYFILNRVADYPPALAALMVNSQDAHVAHADGTPQVVQPGTVVAIHSGDHIQLDGPASLAFVGAQVDLAAGAQLEVVHYGALGNEAQIDLQIDAGQTEHHVTAFGDSRSHYRITTRAGTATLKAGHYNVGVSDDNVTQLAVIDGTATVTAQGKSIDVQKGLDTVIVPGQAPSDPVQWSMARVAVYRPDGSAASLPITLTNIGTNNHFPCQSQQLCTVPQGTYTIAADPLEPYQASGLTLKAGVVNDLPITLGELVFALSDAGGNPVGYSALNIQGSTVSRAVRDNGVLISPGTWTLLVARDDNPNTIQSVKVVVAPGQRLNVPLRNDLFGGGSVKVQAATLDGTPANFTVNVFQSGSENGQPLLSFKAGDTPQPLPLGSYVVVVVMPLSARYELTIHQGENASVDVALGALIVNFTDAQGHPLPRRVYIASAPDQKRLGLPTDQMRQTPYGVAVNSGDKVALPVGLYNVRIDDVKDVEQDGVQIKAGQTMTLDEKAPGS